MSLLICTHIHFHSSHTHHQKHWHWVTLQREDPLRSCNHCQGLLSSRWSPGCSTPDVRAHFFNWSSTPGDKGETMSMIVYNANLHSCVQQDRKQTNKQSLHQLHLFTLLSLIIQALWWVSYEYGGGVLRRIIRSVRWCWRFTCRWYLSLSNCFNLSSDLLYCAKR